MRSLRATAMSTVMLGVLTAAVGLLVVLNSRPIVTIEADSGPRVVEITYGVVVSEIPERSRQVRVWIPMPPVNSQQELLDIDIDGQWQCRLAEESEYGNRFLVFDIDRPDLSGGDDVEITIRFLVRRHVSYPLKQPVAAGQVSPEILARFLKPDRLIPLGGTIAREASSVTAGAGDQLTRSRLLYDHIVGTVKYDRSGTGWGRGDAVYACDVRRGNCTDFHSLFIGEARSLGIPSRFIMGLPLPQDRTEGIIAGYHCWAEFYIDGKGWLPIDAFEAWKHPEKKDSFFAGLDRNRVAFTVGRDIKLPDSASEPLNYAIYAHVEIDGHLHDNVATTFHFRDAGSTGLSTTVK